MSLIKERTPGWNGIRQVAPTFSIRRLTQRSNESVTTIRTCTFLNTLTTVPISIGRLIIALLTRPWSPATENPGDESPSPKPLGGNRSLRRLFQWSRGWSKVAGGRRTPLADYPSKIVGRHSGRPSTHHLPALFEARAEGRFFAEIDFVIVAPCINCFLSFTFARELA